MKTQLLPDTWDAFEYELLRSTPRDAARLLEQAAYRLRVDSRCLSCECFLVDAERLAHALVCYYGLEVGDEAMELLLDEIESCGLQATFTSSVVCTVCEDAFLSVELAPESQRGRFKRH